MNWKLERAFDRGYTIVLLISGRSLSDVSAQTNIPKTNPSQWLCQVREGQKAEKPKPGKKRKTIKEVFA